MKKCIALFLLLFAPHFVCGQEKGGEVVKQLTELQKSITALHTDLSGRAQKTEADILSLQKAVNNIQKELTGRVQKTETEVAQLKKDMSSIKEEIKIIRVGKWAKTEPIEKEQPAFADTSPGKRAPLIVDNPPTPTLPPAVAPTTATVVFYNTFSRPMTVTCNGQTFVVQPGDQRNIDVQAGTYSYVIAGIHSEWQSYVIGIGETQRVTIYDNGYIQPQYPSYYYSPGYYYHWSPGCRRPLLRFFRGCDLRNYQCPTRGYAYSGNHTMTIVNGKQAQTYKFTNENVGGKTIPVAYHPQTHTKSHPQQVAHAGNHSGGNNHHQGGNGRGGGGHGGGGHGGGHHK